MEGLWEKAINNEGKSRAQVELVQRGLFHLCFDPLPSGNGRIFDNPNWAIGGLARTRCWEFSGYSPTGANVEEAWHDVCEHFWPSGERMCWLGTSIPGTDIRSAEVKARVGGWDQTTFIHLNHDWYWAGDSDNACAKDGATKRISLWNGGQSTDPAITSQARSLSFFSGTLPFNCQTW
jgi:hypothetical protein